MNLHRLTRILVVLSALLHPAAAAGDEEAAAARRAAIEVAAAFTNDGFKLRDGQWLMKIQPDEPRLLQVNLYAGNAYWFSAGATGAAKDLEVLLFDETGRPIEAETYRDEFKAAAGFMPAVSGPYYVRIRQIEGGPATFCLIYSYK